jgi:hypothetical protein
MSDTEEVMSPVERPKTKKREITEKQREALAKARLARAVKKEQKKKVPEMKEETNFNFSSNYLIATAVLGLGGLAGYYYLKHHKNSDDFQANLEKKIEEVKESIPKLQTLTERVVYLDKPQIQKVEEKKVEEVALVPSAEEQKKLDYFAGARVI